jgi:predicted ATPase
MGLHSGAPQLVGSRYVGIDVHRAARIAAAGHGGQILLSAAAAELVRHDAASDVTLRDLGAHRLKDLQQAERIYQAVLADLPSDFPALKSLDARPHNLPVQASALLGREREVEAVCKLLRREDVRLVTLTGPGGIGKTRLSLQVAAELLDAFPDGVWQVRLSRLSDPQLVIPTIATTLGLKESGGTPLAEVLRGYLRDKHLLLVLDNYEQVAEAAPQIGELLTACPDVKTLVTSRMTLHLSGEYEYALRPLGLPDPAHLPPPAHLSQYAAVALFIERAQAAQADFQVTNAIAPAVAEICARLDGLPLAIELAAARVKLLPPPALLKRLEHALPLLTGGARDLDARQQTMRNTLAWSYGLLSAEEQRLFRRLAVFVGGCTLEAAEAVCAAPEGAEPLGMDTLEGLSRLVDQSLAEMREEEGEPRFGMLHVVREYALEQLGASGETEAVRRAHLEHFLELARQAPFVIGMTPHHLSMIPRLEREQDNLRAVLTQARDRGWVQVGLEVVVQLGPFWELTAHLTEGRQWTHEFLALATDQQSIMDASTDGRGARFAFAWALIWASNYALNDANVGLCAQLAERGLEIAREFDDPRAIVAGLLHLTRSSHDTDRTEALITESLRAARAASDEALLAWSLDAVAEHYDEASDYEQAYGFAQEALSIAERIGLPMDLAFNCLISASACAGLGDAVQARHFACRALRVARDYRMSFFFPTALDVLAELDLASGTPEVVERGVRLCGASEALRKWSGLQGTAADVARQARTGEQGRKALSEEEWAAAYAAGRALSMEAAIAEALGEQAEAQFATEG